MTANTPPPADIEERIERWRTLGDLASAIWSGSQIGQALSKLEFGTRDEYMRAIGSSATLAEYAKLAKAIGPNTLSQYASDFKAIGRDSISDAFEPIGQRSISDVLKSIDRDSISDAFEPIGQHSISDALKPFEADELGRLSETISALEPLRNLAGSWIAEFESKRNDELEKILAPIRDDHERHRHGYAALGVLCEALASASNDENVIGYPPVLALVEALLFMVGDVHPSQADNLGAVFEPVITPAIEANRSREQTEASKGSHEGRKQQRQFVARMFLDHEGVWDTQAKAIDEIAPALLAWIDEKRKEGRTVSRPIAKTNVRGTVKSWISKLVNTDPIAESKLSDKARDLLKKSRKRKTQSEVR